MSELYKIPLIGVQAKLADIKLYLLQTAHFLVIFNFILH